MAQKNIAPWSEASPPTTEPSYRSSGIAAGTQVVNSDYDWPHYRSDSNVNELIMNQNETVPDLEYDNVTNYNADIDDYRLALMQGNGQWNSALQWANGVDPENYISRTNTSCVMPYWVGETKYLAVMVSSLAANHIYLYDPKDRTQESDSGVLSSITNALDTSGGKQYQIIQGVTDGTDFYVVFDEPTITNGKYVQAFSYDSGTDTWSKKSGWPTNGVSLGTGTIIAGQNLLANIINGSSTKLVVSCNWVNITAASSIAIRVIQKSDGTILTSGAGNATPGAGNNYPCGGLACDGVYVYYTFHSSSGPNVTRLASCDLSNATVANTQLASSNDFTISSGGEVVKHLLYLGDERMISVHITPASTDPTIRTHDVGLVTGNNIAGYDFGTGGACGQYISAVCTDGVYVYILSQKLIAVSTTYRALAVSRVPIASLQFNTNHLSTYDETMEDITTSVAFVNKGSTSSNLDKVGSICFDGRDIWCAYIHDSDYYQPYRIPNGGPK